MQSQEGMSEPARYSSPAAQQVNSDPREQGQWQEGVQELPAQQDAEEERPYQERPYEEGYMGLDDDAMWQPRDGEKLHPRATGQRGPGVLLLLFLLLCACIIGATIFGVLFTWLSWLLLTLLVSGAIMILILNWRTVTIPLPVQTFSVAAQPGLVIKNTMGTISIRRGEDGVISVAPTRRVSGIGVTPENMQVGYHVQDNKVRVSSQVNWNIFQFGLRRMDLAITVPESCDVQVNNGFGRINLSELHGDIQVQTGSGGIEVSALRGNIALKTGSGRINATELRGNIVLKTGSGSISGREINGQVALKTGSGSISMQQTVMAGTSQLRTGSGSITFDGTLDPRGNYEMKTGSGSVQLNLLPDAAFRLNASTGSGRVINEFDGLATSDSLQAPLKVRTGSGSIGVHIQRYT